MKHLFIAACISAHLVLNGTDFSIHTSSEFVGKSVDILRTVAPSIERFASKLPNTMREDVQKGCALLLIRQGIQEFAIRELLGSPVQASPRTLPWKEAIPEKLHTVRDILFLKFFFQEAAQDMFRNRYLTYLCKTYLQIIIKGLPTGERKGLSRKIADLLTKERVIQEKEQ